MNWFRFGNPDLLTFILFGLPVFLFLLRFGWHRKQKAILLYQSSISAAAIKRQKAQIVLFILIFLAIFFSLTFPQWGNKPETVAEKLDVMLALDTSTSMLATDGDSLRRLTHAKEVIFELLGQLHGDRVGLLYFAEAGVVVCPLTDDINTIREFLSALKPESLVHRGTRIGNAIDIAKERFIREGNDAVPTMTNSSGHKVLILLSDSVEAAKIEGISIFCVGFGDSGKAVPIPLPDESMGYKRDTRGQLVLTKLDEEGLSELAKSGNGNYYHTDIGISQLISDLSRIEKQRYKIPLDGELRDRFQWFIFIAIALLVGELLMQHWRMHADN